MPTYWCDKCVCGWIDTPVAYVEDDDTEMLFCPRCKGKLEKVGMAIQSQLGNVLSIDEDGKATIIEDADA